MSDETVIIHHGGEHKGNVHTPTPTADAVTQLHSVENNRLNVLPAVTVACWPCSEHTVTPAFWPLVYVSE